MSYMPGADCKIAEPGEPLSAVPSADGKHIELGVAAWRASGLSEGQRATMTFHAMAR
jgi:hypothetical protein